MSQATARRIALLGAAALVLAGCGADSTDAAGDSTTQTCEDLDAYTDALGNLARTLGADATPEEVQAARDQADQAQRALGDSISDVAKDRTDEINRTWDALVTAFGDVDDQASLSEAAPTLRAEAQDVVDEGAAVREDLDC